MDGRAEPPHQPLEAQLQGTARGLRALARGLLRDPNDQDDALQDTWVATLEHRPVHAGPWQRTVLKRFAFRQGRGRARRREREERVATPEAVGPAIGFNVELETREALVRAVRGLAEPYRSTIVLRFFHERSIDEIAELQHVVPATVRTRTHRALLQLREELDRTHEDRRESWRGRLAVVAGIPSGGATMMLPAVAAGGVALAMKKVVLALGLLILLGVGFVGVRELLVVPAPDAATRPDGPDPAARVAAEPDSVDGSTRHPTLAGTAGPSVPVTGVSGRVVYADSGAAAEGATVLVSRVPDAEEGVASDVHVPTDGNGEFRAYGLHVGRYRLRAVGSSEVGLIASDAEAVVNENEVTDVTLRVKRGYFVAGVVRTAEGDDPISDLEVTFHHESSAGASDADILARTDPEGRFRTDVPLEPGKIWIRAADAGRLEPAGSMGSAPLTLASTVISSGNVMGWIVPYPWDGWIEGFVRGPDGSALPDADVGVVLGGTFVSDLHSLARPTRTDDAGRFRVTGVPTDRTVVVVARRAGLASAASDALIASPRVRRAPLDLQLTEGGVVRGHVRNAGDGSPRADVWVALLRQGTGTGGGRAITDSEGNYIIEAVTPGSYSVAAYLRPSNREIGDRMISVRDGQILTIDFAAPKADEPMLRGVVVDQAGGPWKPEPGASNYWLRAQPLGDTMRLVHGGFIGAQIQADGTFEFSIPAWTGRYSLQLLDTFGFLGAPSVEVEVREGMDEIRIVRTPAKVTLEVETIAAASGEALDRADVFLRSGVEGDETWWGSVMLQTGADGRVAGPPLVPGVYTAYVGARGCAPEVVRVEVGPADSGPRRIVARLRTGRRLRGRVASTEGKAVAGATVAVVATGGYVYPSTGVVSGEDGSFTLDALPEQGGRAGIIGRSYGSVALADADEDGFVIVDPRTR